MRGRAFLVCELPVAVSFAVCGITALLSNIKTSLIVGLLFLAQLPLIFYQLGIVIKYNVITF